jgi:hypothetical protein
VQPTPKVFGSTDVRNTTDRHQGWGAILKIKLIFNDWRGKDGQSEYNWREDLYTGIFHAGTTFNGEIELTPEDESELKEHMQDGFQPVFLAKVVSLPMRECGLKRMNKH